MAIVGHIAVMAVFPMNGVTQPRVEAMMDSIQHVVNHLIVIQDGVALDHVLPYQCRFCEFCFYLDIIFHLKNDDMVFGF